MVRAEQNERGDLQIRKWLTKERDDPPIFIIQQDEPFFHFLYLHKTARGFQLDD